MNLFYHELYPQIVALDKKLESAYKSKDQLFISSAESKVIDFIENRTGYRSEFCKDMLEFAKNHGSGSGVVRMIVDTFRVPSE